MKTLFDPLSLKQSDGTDRILDLTNNEILAKVFDFFVVKIM
mgnify:CR=1 FL=1